MGYRDDFYCVANIAGYSGQLHDFPTVYFHRGSERGRITQKHPLSTNLGRHKVIQSAPDYRVENIDTPEGRRSVEIENGAVIHTSRSLFYPKDGLSKEQIDILSQSIYSWTEKKRISVLRGDDLDIITAALEANDAAISEFELKVVYNNAVLPSSFRGPVPNV